MAWKATGQPTVRKQRGKWVVRVDGIDTVTGKHKPKQLGTYQSQRSANAAAREARAADVAVTKGTVSWLVRRYFAGRTDITPKAQEQYAWAIPHIEAGLGVIQLSMLDRDDVAGTIEGLANGGQLSRRSVQICRTVLRAALSEAVDEGLIPRSPAARVGLPRTVAKSTREKEVETWTVDEVEAFLKATLWHRWAIAFRLNVLYGLRRSELLALRWEDFDDETLRVLARRRAEQAAERLAAGPEGEDNDLIIATRQGGLVLPRSYDRALERFVQRAELPRLTSHGLRHTAATHMVQQSKDLGELRAIADILGHSPDLLMNTYAHALPNSQLAVVERIGRRGPWLVPNCLGCHSDVDLARGVVVLWSRLQGANEQKGDCCEAGPKRIALMDESMQCLVADVEAVGRGEKCAQISVPRRIQSTLSQCWQQRTETRVRARRFLPLHAIERRVDG